MSEFFVPYLAYICHEGSELKKGAYKYTRLPLYFLATTLPVAAYTDVGSLIRPEVEDTCKKCCLSLGRAQGMPRRILTRNSAGMQNR